MTAFTPFPGQYVTLRIDVSAIAEQSEDPMFHDAVKALSTKLYIGYVAELNEFPMLDKPTHKCHVQFVGEGLPTRFRYEGMDESMCVPILPNRKHPSSRIPLEPSPPFPFSDCYQYTCVESEVRVPTQDFDPDSAVSLSISQRDVHMRYITEDMNRLDAYDAAKAAQASPDGPELVQSIASEQPLDASEYKHHDVDHFPQLSSPHMVDDPNSVAQSSPSPSFREHLPQEPIVSLPEDTHSLESDRQSVVSSAYQTDDSDRPASLNSSARALGMAFFDVPDDDSDIIPIVYLSLDLSEATEVPDPNDFLGEKATLKKLIQESRQRQRAAFAAMEAKGATDSSHTRSPEGSWVDLGTNPSGADEYLGDGTRSQEWQQLYKWWHRRWYLPVARNINRKRTQLVHKLRSGVSSARRQLCLP